MPGSKAFQKRKSRSGGRIAAGIAVLSLAIAGALLLAFRHNPSAGHDGSGVAYADSLSNDIYPPGDRAPSDLADALKQAAREHKRVILDFGGNWCGDCRVLDIYFHDQTNLPLLNAHYVLVHINVGQYDENLNLAAKYGVPLQKGVPALVVLNSQGHILVSQRNGEFEAMRRMESSSVTDFLNKWKN